MKENSLTLPDGRLIVESLTVGSVGGGGLAPLAGRPMLGGACPATSEFTEIPSSPKSFDEEAARLLLSSGFLPCDTAGLVSHTAAPQRIGRTLGSVWRAMRRLEGESEQACHAFREVRPLRSN